MNIVFFSTSAFSIPSYKAIVNSIKCVVTKKPKPKGRGYMLEDSEIKKEAERHSIPVVEIDSFKEPNIFSILEFNPHLFVVVSFGLIIPKKILDIPSIGSINVHPSLLPAYRGPSPIQWVLLKGEEKTGITIIKMNEFMDAGDIVYQEIMDIEEKDDAITLSEKLAKRSGELLPYVIKRIEQEGKIEGKQQDHGLATYTPLIKKEMGLINWSASAKDIKNMVRAFIQWPVAYTFIDKKILKIFKSETMDIKVDKAPGTIIDVNKTGILVATGKGVLIIKELQLEGKKRMDAYSFAMGYRGLIGKTFDFC
ncbi:MAG: methionyl-tRNA formyltransferase [Syntrophorhabdaceae bacterium]|nr:methionyl-tRNA formyltransferase [Syntrophorhabdaceae bacterium]